MFWPLERNWYNIDCVTFTRTRSSDVTYDSVWNQCGAIMPNWCNNNIEIIGPKAKVDKLIEGAKKGNLLDTMYPMPKE